MTSTPRHTSTPQDVTDTADLFGEFVTGAALIAQYHGLKDTDWFYPYMHLSTALRLAGDMLVKAHTRHTLRAWLRYWHMLMTVHYAAQRAGHDTSTADAALIALVNDGAKSVSIRSCVMAYLAAVSHMVDTSAITDALAQDVGAVDTDTDNPILQAARDYMTADALAQDVSTDESDTESDASTAQDVTHD